MGKVQRVRLITRIAEKTSLVGVRVANIAHELLEVELVLDQPLAKFLKQLRIAGRVADPNIIDWLDNSDPVDCENNIVSTTANYFDPPTTGIYILRISRTNNPGPYWLKMEDTQ